MKYNKVIFENDYYTIPETIDAVAETFKIEVRDEHKNRSQVYYKMEKQIRRILQKEYDKEYDTKGIDCKNPDKKRKLQYSRGFLNRVVNGKLFPKLCEYADEERKREFEELKKYADEYRAMLEDGRLDAIFKSAQKEEGHGNFDLDYEVKKGFMSISLILQQISFVNILSK